MRRIVFSGVALVWAFVSCGSAKVVFRDPVLKVAVETELGINDPSWQDMRNLKRLWLPSGDITDLSGLGWAINLEVLNLISCQVSDLSSLRDLTALHTLYLAGNPISDISVLANLTHLEKLALGRSPITDLSVVSGLTELVDLRLTSLNISDISFLLGLTRLQTLHLFQNQISDISVLSGMTDLRNLWLYSNRISDISPLSGLTRLTSLELYSNDIQSISALSNLDNLHDLRLTGNAISNLAPLSGLPNLVWLGLGDNQIHDLTILSTLPQLTSLRLWDNQITEVSPLSVLTRLTSLELQSNQIVDISPLTGLTRLQLLDLTDNPLNSEACDHDIPQIYRNNSVVLVRHNPCENTPSVSTYSAQKITANSALLRGHLLSDGNLSTDVRFCYWTGNQAKQYTPWKPADGSFVEVVTGLMPATPYEVYAEARNALGTDNGGTRSFETLTGTGAGVVYVDDDAPHDPVPHNAGIGDPDEDGSPGHPYDMIQEGIDAAAEGQTVRVLSGTYWETIDFNGKRIIVLGVEPNEPAAVIDANYRGTVVTFANGEDSNTELSGFVLTRGLGDLAGGILCVGSDPTITNCLIVGNRALGLTGAGAIYCDDSQAVIDGCTLSGNVAGPAGAGVFCVQSDTFITNSIVWRNAPTDIGFDLFNDPAPPTVSFSDLGIAFPGDGNISTDPGFVLPGFWALPDDPQQRADPGDIDSIWVEGDYHLAQGSPCIDTGDPNYLGAPDQTDLDGNARIFNERLDMGTDEYVSNVRRLVAAYGDVLIDLAPDVNAPDPERTYVGQATVYIDALFRMQMAAQAEAASTAGGTWTVRLEPSIIGPMLEVPVELHIEGRDINIHPLAIQPGAVILAMVELGGILAP